MYWPAIASPARTCRHGAPASPGPLRLSSTRADAGPDKDAGSIAAFIVMRHSAVSWAASDFMPVLNDLIVITTPARCGVLASPVCTLRLSSRWSMACARMARYSTWSIFPRRRRRPLLRLRRELSPGACGLHVATCTSCAWRGKPSPAATPAAWRPPDEAGGTTRWSRRCECADRSLTYERALLPARRRGRGCMCALGDVVPGGLQSRPRPASPLSAATASAQCRWSAVLAREVMPLVRRTCRTALPRRRQQPEGEVGALHAEGRA